MALLSRCAAWVLSGVVAASAVLVSGAPAAQPAAAATSAPAPISTWPRTFTKGGTTVIVYQPQVDAWKDHSTIRFRCAVAVTTAGSTEVHYGVVAAQADTFVDSATRQVMLTNIDPAVRFPGLTDAQAAPLKAATKDCLGTRPYVATSLDAILSYMHDDVKNVAKVPVSLDPPPIYYSDTPAVLVIFMGAPVFKPVGGSVPLSFAVNTNWVVLQDNATSNYFMLINDSWYTTSDVISGPWSAASTLPAAFSSLPTGGNWQPVVQHIPGTPATSVPRVIVSTQPAELILTDGPIDYASIPGTRLMYVDNPSMPLFLDMTDLNYYYLVAGRWFRAATLQGPWSAASANLPAEFAKIPPDSPMGFVLASVPGTQEAADAVLLSTIPHKATINIQNTTVNVAYEGTPKFEPIQGTSMTYATNTSYQVINVSGVYYCCYNGVWFTSPAPTGAWVVCTSVPQVIYTIPPASPVYNCTYVQVYSSTPSTVVVGYTSGYSGEYVAATGALMFGAGMLVGAALSSNNCCWYGYPPCYYSYGCAAHYSYAYGGYYRAGGACYGPYGGAGWGAAYNPATGTYARGGEVYGPNGAHWGAQAYNPYTNTYAQHTGGTNGYSSWGSSYVSQGDKWAQASHQSNARGSVGEASNSSGQWAEGAHSNVTNSTVAKTSNGDTYAAHDGNVYKNDGNGWQKYDGNGNWSDTSWNKSNANTSTYQAHSTASQAASSSSWSQSAWKNDFSSGNSNWKSNWENGSGSTGTAWNQHDTQQSLNQDSWARSSGGAASSSAAREGNGAAASGSGWGQRASNEGWGQSGGGWGNRESGGGWGGGSRDSGGSRWGGGGGGWGGGGRGFGGGGRRR